MRTHIGEGETIADDQSELDCWDTVLGLRRNSTDGEGVLVYAGRTGALDEIVLRLRSNQAWFNRHISKRCSISKACFISYKYGIKNDKWKKRNGLYWMCSEE